MSNKVMVVWAVLIVLILCTILVIGKNEEKIRRLKNQEKSYDDVIISYIENNNIEFINNKIQITSEELKEKGYIKEIRRDDSVCIFVATVTKNEEYDIKYTYECKIF